MMMVFASREEAGLMLGRCLQEQRVRADLVLGLPRGGVIVAASVADALHLPLDVILVRKIGHPFHREFAVGALAEQNIVVLDDDVIGNNPAVRAELQGVIHEEKERLQSYQARFHPNGPPDLTGKTVLLVDDGLATGATTEAAVLAVQQRSACGVMVTAPVASTNAVQRLARVADEVRVLCVDPGFVAVGHYYEAFAQTTDDEVMRVLQRQTGQAVRRES